MSIETERRVTSMSIMPTVQDLFDPRGRASRSGLLAVAALLMAADAVAVAVIMATGAAFTGPGALAFKIISVWIATAAVAKRLHDVGRSAWWVVKGLVALVGWSIVVAALLLTRFNAADAVNPGHIAFWINLSVTAAPTLAALIWLHVARGTPGANRFGPEPDARGFSRADQSGDATSLVPAPLG